jgi:O-antigen/teichoic acid export membrane protein
MYLLSILRGQQRFGLFNLRRVLGPAGLLAGVIGLVGFAGWGLRGAILAFGLSALLSLVVGLILTRRTVPLDLQFDRQFTGQALRFGSKSYLQNLIGHLHYRLDVYLLALILGDTAQGAAQVAFYIVATSIAEFAFYIPDSVGTVLFPKLSAEGDERIHALTAEVTRHTFLATGLAGLALAVAGSWLIPLVYGSDYQAAIAPLLLLLPGILAMAVYKVISRNFTSRNRQQVSVLAAGLALAVNLGLNLYFIPRWGVSGAALSSSLSYGLAAVVILAAFRRESGIALKEILFINRLDLNRYKQVWERAWFHMKPRGSLEPDRVDEAEYLP